MATAYYRKVSVRQEFRRQKLCPMGFDGLLILNTAGSLVANNGAENHCKHLFQGGGGGGGG